MNFIQKENFHVLSEANIAVRSPLRSNRGPALVLMGTFNSLAMTCASVVLPVREARTAARGPALRRGSAPHRWQSGYFSLTRFLAYVFIQPLRPHAHVNARVFVITPVQTQSVPAVSAASSALPFRRALFHHKKPAKHNTERTEVGAQSTERKQKLFVLLRALCVKFFPCSYGRAARPFGAVKDCNAARSSFSKFAVPAARFASPTAPSAARPSYPRFTSAEITSASTAAGDARPRSLGLYRHNFQPVLQFHHHALRGFFFRRRGFSSAAPDRSANRRDQFFYAHPAQNLQRQRRSHPGSGKQHLEKMFSRAPTQTRTVAAHLPARVCGSEESLRCAARRARRTSRAGPARGTRRRSRPRALGSVFFGEPSAELANHRSPVLPLFLRPSTRSRDTGIGESKSALFYFYR